MLSWRLFPGAIYLIAFLLVATYTFTKTPPYATLHTATLVAMFTLAILGMFAMLAKETRPAAFFGVIGMALTLMAALLAAPIALTYFQTGLVPRLPTFVLATGLVLSGTIAAVCGLILDSLARARIEAKRAVFLSHPAPQWPR